MTKSKKQNGEHEVYNNYYFMFANNRQDTSRDELLAIYDNPKDATDAKAILDKIVDKAKCNIKIEQVVLHYE